MRSFLSIHEAADVLGVQYKTIYRLIRRNALPAAKIGRVYRIKYDDLLAYFEAQKVAPPGEPSQLVANPHSMAQERP